MKEISNPPAILRAAETLDELALVINSAYAAAEEATRKGIERYREVGLMLVEAKKKCGHGKWLPWLKANVKFSEQHSRRYMALAKTNTVSDLEGAWRVITGRDEPEQEPEPVDQPAPKLAPRAAPAPKVAPRTPELEPERVEEPGQPASAPEPAEPKKAAKAEAKKPELEPEAPTEEPAPKPPKPAPTVDGWGIPIQDHAAAAFAAVPKFRELVQAIQHAQRLFNEVTTSPGGEFLRLPSAASYRRGKKGADGEHADRYVHTGLEQCLQHVKAAVPKHTVCPYQFAEGAHPDDCRTCLNLKWTPELSSSVPPVCTDRARAAFNVTEEDA